MGSMKLKGKQVLFCCEYVRNGYNATQAAIDAGYSKKCAGTIGYENLRKPQIKERIEQHKANLEELLNISRAKVLNEHIKIAFSSIAHLHNTWIEKKEFEELTDVQKACISEIVTQTRTTIENDTPIQVEYVKIKLFDKTKALDSISKIMGYDAPVKMEMTDHVIKFVDVSKEYHKENHPQ